MPPARTASAASRRARSTRGSSRSRPRRAALRGPRPQIRWDRAGRAALLVVLAVVAALYVERTLSYLTIRSQADSQLATVHQLTRENAALADRAKSLTQPATIARDARALGMARVGERSYVVSGLPKG